MQYYDIEFMIEDIKALIKRKEEELLALQTLENISPDTLRAVKIQQLLREIDELRIQVQYHENYITDQMMKRCSGCTNGCCRYKYFQIE